MWFRWSKGLKLLILYLWLCLADALISIAHVCKSVPFIVLFVPVSYIICTRALYYLYLLNFFPTNYLSNLTILLKIRYQKLCRDHKALYYHRCFWIFLKSSWTPLSYSHIYLHMHVLYVQCINIHKPSCKWLK